MTQDEQIDAIYAMLVELTTTKKATARKEAEGEIATDADLDGKYGDEEIRKMPSAKYWSGEDHTGRRMSETSAEFLDAFAKYKNACAYMAEREGNPDKAKYVGYDRKSAARARGWAKRLRDGFKPKSDDLLSTGGSSDDIPF